MTGPTTSLDHDAALRAAGGFTDVGDAVGAGGRELRAALTSVSWGSDTVGAALAARHAARATELVDAVDALAEQLRGLHAGVRAAVAGLTGTDGDAAADTTDLDRGRG
ncbi:hypothetical protein RHODO2019_03305 [Rhodococcus antarcticus]|uniref:Excreted virulence factor EspC (Type VII ESX diderm) n=1 Tax=Rhodococcus antarcticus TaxID=2987751 RepID=A0ABY6P1H2_9NOCA|nr:hypothetical protein [Rhodococcus antarcticus]UZJ25510.1 hypothetical protein RHODO2019_03305 [Rhodococcus antarcticus]